MAEHICIKSELIEPQDIKIEYIPPNEEDCSHPPLSEVNIKCETSEIAERLSPKLEFEVDESKVKIEERGLEQTIFTIQPVQNTMVEFECYNCKIAATSIASLRRHMNNHLGQGKSFPCNLCGNVYKRKDNLKRHIRSQHEEKRFQCSECSKKFVYEPDLKRHINIRHTLETDQQARPVHRDRSRSCPLCKKVIKNGHLTNHMRIHTGEKPFECSECFKKFVSAGELKAHMFVHTNDRPFSCKVCAKQFKAKDHVRQHMLTHRNEKRFSCSECSEKFKSSGGLKIHLLCHRGEKPFECKLCSYKCTTSSRLSDHMRTSHTGEKPFSCAYCPKSFSLNNLLKIHLRVHTGERPYPCNECPKKFSIKAALKRHYKVHMHKDQK